MGSSYSNRRGNREQREGGRSRTSHNAPSANSNPQPQYHPQQQAPASNAGAPSASNFGPYPLPHQYYLMQNGLNGQPVLMGGHRLIPANQLPSFFLEGIRPDLAFLPFQTQPRIPQPPPPQMQHTQTIRNDVNLKKNSLRLVKDESQKDVYRIEFSFDASTECNVTVFWIAIETTESTGPATFKSMLDAAQPQPRHFPKSLGQMYVQEPSEALRLSQCKEEDLIYQPNSNQYPVIIRLETVHAESGEGGRGGVQSQSTFATFTKLLEGGLGIKVLKQKILVGGVSYELQEIYGIEQTPEEQEGAENGRECVICMSEPRDTTLLPCRHMCMCNECAKVLRYQTNKCPICRSPVESLLQIKVSKKDKTQAPDASSSSAPPRPAAQPAPSATDAAP